MRVPSDDGGPAPPPPRSGESSSSQSSAFDRVLQRKSGEQKAKQKGAGPANQRLNENGPATAAGGIPFLLMGDLAPSAIPKPDAAPEIRDLDGLVHEITVVAGPGTTPRVEIQFQSKTVEGLNVQISRKGDEISIRLLTGSNSLAQLLSRNSSQLSQALEAKGLQVAPIEVRVTHSSSRSTDSDASPSYKDGRRERGDGRQQRQQK